MHLRLDNRVHRRVHGYNIPSAIDENRSAEAEEDKADEGEYGGEKDVDFVDAQSVL